MLVRTAFGTKLSVWFQNDPAPTTIIPRQVAMLLPAFLGRVKAQYEQDEVEDAIAKDAFASYAKVFGAARRRRAELLNKSTPIA